MKNAFFVVFILLIISCNKDENQNFEKQILSLLEVPAISIDTVVESTSDWVYGFKFRPKKQGKIGHIGMKIPKKGTYTAILWDLDNNIILHELKLTSNKEHEEVYKKIPDVEVNAGMNLGLMLNANTFYRVRKDNNQSFDFPISLNHIFIDSYHENQVSGQNNSSFPEDINDTQLSPCIDLVFIDQ